MERKVAHLFSFLILNKTQFYCFDSYWSGVGFVQYTRGHTTVTGGSTILLNLFS